MTRALVLIFAVLCALDSGWGQQLRRRAAHSNPLQGVSDPASSHRSLPRSMAGTRVKGIELFTGDQVVPYISNGNGGGIFSDTLILVTNVTNQPASVAINFFSANGQPVSLPLADDGQTQSGLFTGVQGTVPALGRGSVLTWASGASATAYAEITSMPANAFIATTLIFRSDGNNLNTVITFPMLNRFDQQTFLSFAESISQNTRIVLVNDTPFAEAVTGILLSADGQELCRDVRQLAGNTQQIFQLQDRFPCSANSEGTLQILTDGPLARGVTGLSIVTANSDGTQSVFLPLARFSLN